MEKSLMENYELLETWYEHLENDKDKESLSDLQKTYTRQEVELLSGKIYNYLLSKGIGKDDFVFIDLPRSGKILIAMLGVAKAGAAFVAIESDFPKERREFIKQDTDCKMVIDSELFDKLDSVEYKKGYQKADAHDAAFAIYTSGTTGTPKGVVHEYGNYGMLYHSIRDPKSGALRENVNTRFLSIAPFNFIASVMIFGLYVYSGGHIFVPDYSVIKNGIKLVHYMNTNKINETFFPPSILKTIESKLNPEMKLIYTGSEPAINVAVSRKDVELHNLYLMSEALFVLCQRQITEPMEVTPIGKPNDGIELSLNSKGEIIVLNPFCRGYIHKEENKAFKDDYYNTGDLAELNEDGEYVLKGRSTDTIKINGNRVEPLEIETVASKLLKNKPCAAKGFTKGENTYICLYYEAKKEVDKNELTQKMEEYLPYYMIPSFYVRVDELPKTKLGKLNRKALREPAVVASTAYVEPTTEIQKKMCEAFKKVLEVERLGIDDDLFELGLNSLLAIDALTELDLDEIQSSTLYRARTIRALENSYNEALAAYKTPEEKEEIGRQHVYPLVGMAAFFNMIQELTGCTIDNITSGWKFGPLVNPNKLKAAINQAMDDASTFKVKIFKDEEGHYLQKYDPSVYTPVAVEYMTEDEVEEVRKSLVRPFKITEEPPYRIRLIKTKKATYLFTDISHTIMDGKGMSLFGENIVRAYLGKPLRKDYFFAYCFDEKRKMESGIYAQNIAHAKEKLVETGYATCPLYPGDIPSASFEKREAGITIKKLQKYLEEEHVTRGAVIFAAMSLALAKYSKSNKNMISYNYMNRESISNIAGCLMTAVPIGFNIEKNMTIEDLYGAARNEMMDGMAYCCQTVDTIRGIGVPMCINDLEDMLDAGPLVSKIAKPVALERPFDYIKGQPLKYIKVDVKNVNGKLELLLELDNVVWNKETRVAFMDDFVDVLKRLIANDKTVIADYAN